MQTIVIGLGVILLVLSSLAIVVIKFAAVKDESSSNCLEVADVQTWVDSVGEVCDIVPSHDFCAVRKALTLPEMSETTPSLKSRRTSPDVDDEREI